MRPVSNRFLDGIGRPHQMVTEVDVLFNREVIAEGLAVSSGSVTFDRQASVRGRCRLTLAEPFRPPTGVGDILSPYGFEVRVRRGLRFPVLGTPLSLMRPAPLLSDTGDSLETDDGDPLLSETDVLTKISDSEYVSELVGLGIFPIQVSNADAVTLVTSIEAADRSQQVRDARIEDDFQIAAGTPIETAVQSLIAAGVSGLEFSLPATGFTTPAVTLAAQDDRWDAASQLARSAGFELFFDGGGVCSMRAEPNLSTAVPVWTVAEGDGGVLVGASVRLDRRNAYNRVIAYSSNSSTVEVFRGVATDNDPSSPTYYFGPFGRRPRFYASTFIASTGQAVSAARAILNANIGVARSVDMSMVPNPALEPADVILIRRQSLGLDEPTVLDALTVGLAPEDVMSAQSRARGSADA